MSAKLSGPWGREQVDLHLRETVAPLRLACNTSSGWPVVLSLWFDYEDGALWCATSARSRTARRLRADDRVAFELGPNDLPYRGVRGRGRAVLDPGRGEEVLRRLIRRFLGAEDSSLARWLLSRAEGEVAIRIEPLALSSWDYTERMTERR